MKPLKFNTWLTGPVIFLAALSAHAVHANQNQHGQAFEYAKVVHASPVYRHIETREPVENCWTETVRVERPQYRGNSKTPTLVGGLIGGAIGNAVGSGKRNKQVGAVVGTLIGMSIGRDKTRANSNHQNVDVAYRDEQRCETRYITQSHQQLNGYNVTYRYKGQTYSTFTEREPGERIKLAVSFRPVNEY